MRRLLIGLVIGAASAVIVTWAQIIAWGLMGQHYDDDDWQGIS